MSKVLIVDDSEIIRIQLRKILEDAGYDSAEASDGSECLELIEKSSFDIVLLDMYMKNMHGLEVLGKVRQLIPPSSLPIIMVTAEDGTAAIVQCLKEGANDYVLKPINPQVLIARIETHLEICEMYRERQLLTRVLAHDIKNHLAIIFGNAGILRRKLALDHQKEKDLTFVNKIEQGALNVTAIVNDVLEMEALSSNKESVELTSTRIDDIVQYLENTFVDKASAKGISLSFQCDDTLRLQFCKGNELNLKVQVFSNLLSNAIKFSNFGDTIFFVVKKEAGWIDFTIRDTGIGMPQELVSNIFKESVATTRTGTDGEKGTGFGMPITKKYLDRFGGIITVQSKNINKSDDDHGTVFTVRLPSHIEGSLYETAHN